jgi:hypothetical protein
MQIDSNVSKDIRVFKRSKWLALTIVLLYFIVGQVYPCFHIHHQDTHHQTEIDLCNHPADREHNFHQCCEQHRYCHVNVESDWQFVLSNFKDIKKKARELFLDYIINDELNSNLIVYTFDYHLAHKTLQTTSKLFNKAPPTLI